MICSESGSSSAEKAGTATWPRPQAASPNASAVDADLQRRQRQAEALLSNIQTAQPAPSPFAKARSQGARPVPASPALPTTGGAADKPWWAPDWAATPDPTPAR